MKAIAIARAWRTARYALVPALLLIPGPLAATASCGSTPGEPVARESRAWPAPLDRRVTLQLRDVPLRDALDRLAAAARLRLSYNDEQLPLDRQVCVSFRALYVGDALVHLLAGTRLDPVPGGPDHVVLAPGLEQPVPPEPAPGNIVTLDRIVVTGSASGAPQRQLPTALAVIGRRVLAAEATGTVSQLMSAGVPGVWMWEQSPGSVLARYGSIRGASSFGVTAPKVYLDGIEVANPLLFSQLAPGAVERIEVIRGPQGTALYGADALSGVVNIVTRREHLEPGTPRARLQSVVGMTASDFATGGALSALAQDHALAVRSGTDQRYAGLDIAFGSIGPYMPGAFNRHITADGSARLVFPRTIVTATARFFAMDAGVEISPLLRDSVPTTTIGYGVRSPVFAWPDSVPNPQKVEEYTFGTNATFMQSDRWTHSLVAGVDGYTLNGVVDDYSPIPSAAQSALEAARGSATRASVRVSSVARFGDGERASGTLTLAGEQSVLRERTASPSAGPLTGSPLPSGNAANASVLQWQRTTAGVVQANASLRNTLFLSGGLRAEQDAGLAGGARTALLPMVGMALARDQGPVTVKLRAAYGRGIRPPQTPSRETMWTGIHSQVTDTRLEPERQSGVEAGLDVIVGGVATLQLTRYDQLASGLIQRVGMAEDSASSGPHGPGGPPTGTPGSDIYYQLQNMGAITNRGWEMQLSGNFAHLLLSGTLSYTDSRIRSVAVGYTGDLRPGDRTLEVPAWTGALLAAWTSDDWSAALTTYRAYDWIAYDRLALTRDYLAGSRASWQLVGPALRDYWRRYTGITHVRASASRRLAHGFTLLLTADNLLNKQTGEPDNITVLPGRTFTLGLRAAF